MKIVLKPPNYLVALLVLSLMATAGAQTQLTFTQSFGTNPIGPTSTTTLTFIISDLSGPPAQDVAFTDVLPAAVVIATPSSAFSDCDGILSAPDGGGTISLTGGRVGANGSCTITVNVTSGTVGTHTNNAGVATSSNIGSSSPASADLVVDAGLPGFTKSFSPGTIPPGGTSTLTLTIDNTHAGSVLTSDLLSILDLLPAGMAIATPANASTNCTGPAPFFAPAAFNTGLSDGGTGTTSFISLSGVSLGSASSCTATVDVTAPNAGTFVNTTLALLQDVPGPDISIGFATAVLNVPRTTLTKSFTDDPVAPGGTVNLEFTITNTDRVNSMSSIAFTDDLTAALSGLSPTGPSISACNGGTLAESPSGVLDFSGGSLAPDASCTFSVTLNVPTGSTGAFTNTTSAISFDVGAGPETGNTATDILVVEPAPVLTKEFTNDPVTAGSTVDLQFTITNTSSTSMATDIAFEDFLPTILPTAVGTAASDCGGTVSFTPLFNPPPPGDAIPANLSLSGGILGSGASCTIDITLDVAETAAAAPYTNTTSAITATVGGGPIEGLPASDILVVVAAPDLTKAFTNDPVAPDGTVTLEFTLVHNDDAPGDAINISFTDDLSFMTGLSYSGPTLNNICGSGSSLSESGGVLTFANGTLTPGSDCTFSLSLDVSSAAPGTHTNITNNITADVASTPVSGNQATADLEVVALALTKDFTDDPVDPGGTVTLKFTLTNSGAPTDTATAIFFRDDLKEILGISNPSITATGTSGCGGTLSAVPTSFLTFSGGSLAGGLTCNFSVTLSVPAGAAPDTYGNTTIGFRASFDGGTTTTFLPNASANLVVAAPATIALSKSFDDETPPAPGDNVTLGFTIGYDGPSNATAIGFTDNLEATLSGLAMTAVNANDCGGTVTGTSTIELSGGTLSPGATCTINVDVLVPLTAPDTTVTNTTSSIAATVGTQGISGDPASDDLTIVTIGSSEGDNAGRGNVPPLADAGPDTTVDCTSADGAEYTLDGTNSSDPNGDDLTFSWSATGITFDDATSATPTATFPLGSTTVTLIVDDGNDNTDTDQLIVTVQDTTAPTITLNGENPLELIRFSGPYVELATVTDVCDPTVTLTFGGDAVNTNLPGTYVVTYDAVDASSNDADQKTRTVNVIDDPAALEHDFLFLAGQKLILDKLAQAAGDFHSNDEVNLTKGAATFTGNVTAVGKIDIADDITVTGDVTSGDEVQLGSNVTTGTVSEFASVAPEPLPSLSFSAGGSNILVAVNQTQALSPDSYGTVTLEEGATLQLSTGEYFFEKLDLKKNTTLEIDIPTGPVEVNVVQAINFDLDATMTLTPLGEVDSRYVTIRSLSDIQLTADGASNILGQWIISGSAALKKGTRLRGSICAGGTIDVEEDVDAVQHDAQEVNPTAPAGENVTGVSNEAEIPEEYTLEQNHPNPFNPSTTITFALPEAGDATLAIYNLRGQHVQTLHSGQITAGRFSVVWDGRDDRGNSVPSGIYFYRLQAGEVVLVKKMSLLK